MLSISRHEIDYLSLLNVFHACKECAAYHNTVVYCLAPMDCEKGWLSWLQILYAESN